jgi:hypothetical protein
MELPVLASGRFTRAVLSPSRKGTITMSNKTAPNKIGRDARTGQYIPVKEAERRPSTTVVETRPKPPSKPKK